MNWPINECMVSPLSTLSDIDYILTCVNHVGAVDGAE